MPTLALTLLGGFHVTRDGRPVTRFRGDKVRGLLAYLAIEAQRPVARSLLAALFWPEQPDDRALRNLAQALVRLREALGDDQGTLLEVTRQAISWRPGTAVDVTEFARLAQRDDPASLQAAADRYGGELLSGFALDGCEAFEEWLLLTRERLAQLALSALARLAEHHLAARNFAAAAAAARRHIAIDPWREAGHRLLMRALAGLGERAAALAAYERCRSLLLDDLGVDPDEATTALHRQIRDALPAPAGARAGAPRHNLPAQLTSFVGRRHELQAIRRALGAARLVTLAGPGGCGKTRLALQLAAELAHDYPDGAWLVELAPLGDPALVPQAVAAALGLRESAGQPPDDLLAAELRSRSLLLVLDNCEHLLAACRRLAAGLLRGCPGLTILATSREVLGIAGEQIWQVPALAVPGPQEDADPERLGGYEAVALFVARAAAARAGFALTPANAAAVAQICRQLDGIPLAIELAAVRVRHLPPELIAARLDDRFKLLTGGSPTALPRHQALRSTVDWSYDLLGEPERAFLRRLAVFAGRFSLQDAEAVACGAAGAGPPGPRCGDMLALLADKSLLIVEDGGPAPRYRTLETIRAYAREKLEAAGEGPALRDRHLAHYLAVAEEAEPHLFAPGALQWLDRLEADHDNLRAALDWALARPEPQAALRLAAALRSFWYTRGHYAEGRRRLLQVLAAPGAQAPTPARAKALNAAGAMLWTVLENAAEALPLLEEALAIGEQLGDRHSVAWAQLHLGTIAYRRRDYAAAEPLLRAGLAISRTEGAAGRRGAGWALIRLGDIALDRGRRQEARQHYEDAAALLRELSDSALLAYPLRCLAHLALDRGDIDAAAALCGESLRANLAIGDALAVAACVAGFVAIAAAEARAAAEPGRSAWLRRGARLYGAAQAMLAAAAEPLWPADAAALDAGAAELRAALGAAAFAAAAAAGRAAGADEALAGLAAHAGRPDAAGPARARPPHSLPGPHGPLLGRAEDVAELCRMLQQPDIRLICLTGPGGVGKTGLALQVAAEVGAGAADLFPDGVCFVDLAPVSAVDLVADTIAQALAVGSARGAPPLSVVREYLHDRQLLLVLDNFEQVVEAAPVVAALLAGCPRLKVIATSRRALRIRTERIYPVPALALPPLKPLPAPDALATYPSVALFVRCAQAVLPAFRLDHDSAAAVAAICARVDGLPLAIELAAARLRLFPPADLLARLDARMRELTGGARDLPPRQRAISATLSWSHNLLTGPAQLMFARLGVFVGGLSPEAARQVCADPQDAAGDGLDALAELVDHSLIRHEPGADGRSRFRMLETIREYALERLDARGETAALQGRHGRFYLALAEAAEPQLQGADQAAWLDRLEAEHDNLRAALEWALAGPDAEPPLRLAAALGEFWWPRGHISEGRRWLARALGRSPAATPARAKALYRAGELAYGQSDYPQALALLQESLTIYRREGDRRGAACALRGLGNTWASLADTRRAAACREESLALFRAVGDLWGTAWMLLEIGRDERDPGRQADLLQQSLALARSGGYTRTIATALGNLGKLARSAGEAQQARELLRGALEIGRQLGDRWVCAWMLRELALLARAEGDEQGARTLLDESQALFELMGIS